MKMYTVMLTNLTLCGCVTFAAQTNPRPAGADVTEHTKVEDQVNAQLEPNTAVMESTFKIVGPNSIGSGFIVGRPFGSGSALRYRYVLVTAAHVFADTVGEFVDVVYRRQNASGTWGSVTAQLRIRQGIVPLWTQHPQADVAVMYVSVPDGVMSGGVLSTEVLADDAKLRSYGIHPGDEVSCVGFPMGAESKPSGFPILRTGKIASYPLLPTIETKYFLIDFPVFPGNSGGPAYILYGGMRGNQLVLGTGLGIVGLVSREQIFANRIPLGIAEVVHATLISATISQLPAPDQN